MARVVIVTGAGASHDCISSVIDPDNEDTRPPLTAELFSLTWKSTLERYPLVRQSAGSIRQAMDDSNEDAVGLEDYLRERMAASKSPYTHRSFRQIPLYLQDVLWQASHEFTREPDNYNVLVGEALELDEALFLTLNYDTFLDSRLQEFVRRYDFGWYVDADDRWSLVKLHGSVDWGYRLDISGLDVALSGDPWAEVNDVVDVYAQRGFPNFSSEHIQLLQQGPLKVVRQDRSSNRAAYYPALALPLGPADEIVCPPSHIDAAKAAFARMDGLNLLVIGYSGLDEEVLRLFSESKNSIRRMLVANGDDNHTGAQYAADRIANAFNVEVNPAWVTEYGFSSLVETGALRRWMSEVA